MRNKKENLKDCIEIVVEEMEAFIDSYEGELVNYDQEEILDFLEDTKESLRYGLQLQGAQEVLMHDFKQLFHEAISSRVLDKKVSRKIDDIFENNMVVVSQDKMRQLLDEEATCGYTAGKNMMVIGIRSTVEKFYKMALASKNKEAIKLFEDLKRELF